jgi:hypothetical protein
MENNDVRDMYEILPNVKIIFLMPCHKFIFLTSEEFYGDVKVVGPASLEGYLLTPLPITLREYIALVFRRASVFLLLISTSLTVLWAADRVR